MQIYSRRSVHFFAFAITETVETRPVRNLGSGRRVDGLPEHGTALKPIPAPLLVALGALALALVRLPRLRALAGLASGSLLPHGGSRARLPAGSHHQRALPSP
jgi:hypothetical protein